MRKVDQLEDAVDQSEAKRQEGVHRAQAQPVDHLLEQHAVVGHYFRLLWLHRRRPDKIPLAGLGPTIHALYPSGEARCEEVEGRNESGYGAYKVHLLLSQLGRVTYSVGTPRETCTDATPRSA